MARSNFPPPLVHEQERETLILARTSRAGLQTCDGLEPGKSGAGLKAPRRLESLPHKNPAEQCGAGSACNGCFSARLIGG